MINEATKKESQDIKLDIIYYKQDDGKWRVIQKYKYRIRFGMGMEMPENRATTEEKIHRFGLE